MWSCSNIDSIGLLLRWNKRFQPQDEKKDYMAVILFCNDSITVPVPEAGLTFNLFFDATSFAKRLG